MKKSSNKKNAIHVFQKVKFLLLASQKRQLIIIAGLLFIGMLFEMMSLGILIPALGIMLNSDIAKSYPILTPYLHFIGDPSQRQLIIWGISSIMIIFLMKAIFLIYSTWRQSKFSSELAATLAQNLFIGYLRQPYSFHLKRNSAELIRNIQSEVAAFNSVSMSLISLTLEMSAIIGIAFMLIFVEPLGAIVVTSFLGISSLLFYQLTKNKILSWGKGRQFHGGFITKHLLEGLGGVKEIKLFGREDFFLKEYVKHYTPWTKIQVNTNTLNLMPRMYLELLAVIGLAGLVVLMVAQNKPMDSVLPTLAVFVAAAFRMIPSTNRIMNSIQQVRFARPVIDLIYNEFKMIRYEEANSVVFKNKLDFSKNLVVTNLSFCYSGASTKALDGVSIKVEKGQSVGFMGQSGSGKSTLVDLILGLLTPDSGEISVDSQNIQNDLRCWQNQIGYVPQSIYLTDDTLRRNVAFGIENDKIDNNSVVRAIKAAQLDEFVGSLPQGLETYVGERGVRLSGGQRQRIGIARALYNDPEVLVLDEATSALDSENEKEVMLAIAALQGHKTILIVAHRLSTINNCDKIYKLNKGKIIAEGIPQIILESNKLS